MAARRETVPLIVLALLLLRPDDAAAQAWLPEKGNFSLTAAVSDNFNKKHYLPDGEEIDVGHTRTNIVAFSFSYGMTDRLTVTAGIPYVQGKYDGPRPHPTAVDDGDYHGSVTDVHLGLHFQALDEPFALAPYSTVVIPVRDYETLGHAAPGRGLEELWFGFYADKSLDLWIPRTYIQGRYNYAFVEKVAGVAHDRSNADLEIGYFLSPEWSIRAVVSAVETHGGIPFPSHRRTRCSIFTTSSQRKACSTSEPARPGRCRTGSTSTRSTSAAYAARAATSSILGSHLGSAMDFSRPEPNLARLHSIFTRSSTGLHAVQTRAD